MKKITGWKTRGMNRDISVSAFNNEFSFENVNLRIMTNEGNTALSWVNEKGTAQITLVNSSNASTTISGTPIGTAVLNRTLVLFTTTNTSEAQSKTKADKIYKLSYKDAAKTIMEVVLLFSGNLNFSTLHPLETMVSYEAEHIQKVYWVDGRNQPRIINIMDTNKLTSNGKWYKYSVDSTTSSSKIMTFFDFQPTTQLQESVAVERVKTGGEMFPPGVIQYCFTYINKYAQQTCVAWTSALYYLTFSDRGVSPENEVVNAFKITINGPDENFDYLRLYSIQRTSINETPIVKILDDIPITSIKEKTVNNVTIKYLEYIDNGTTGSTIDPTELLYVGGRDIVANTLIDKDGTLFIGNFSQQNVSLNSLQSYFDNLRKNNSINAITFHNNEKEIPYGHLYGMSNDMYINSHTLIYGSKRNITTFKGGEWYRFGFQLQKNTGEWTEAIFLKDEENNVYPTTVIEREGGSLAGTVKAKLVHAETTLNLTAINTQLGGKLRSDYKKIRPVVVYPTVGERTVLCQGVVNPTVFNIADRIDNSPFAQSSWYFRPYMISLAKNEESEGSSIVEAELVSNVDYESATAFNAAHPAFPNSGETPYNTGKYWPVICNIPKEEDANEILQRKYLKYKFIDYDQITYTDGPVVVVKNNTGVPNYADAPYNYTMGFYGGIYIGDQEEVAAIFGKDAYLLLLNWAFVKEYCIETGVYGRYDEGRYNSMEGYRETHKEVKYQPEVKFNKIPSDAVASNDYSYTLYSGLAAQAGQLYYINPTTDEDNNQYVFRIYYEYLNSKNSTTVIPSCIEITLNSTAQGYVVIKNNTSGNGVQYLHYSSLPTQDGEAKAETDKTTIEIQGSYGDYATPYGDRKESPVSNSQFCIDQSIITMHSPDIEFDTEVQNYNTEDLKMRIVGIVPITSNASAHRIMTSSAKLETSHNIDNKLSKNFGVGETNDNVVHKNIDTHAGQRLVAEYMWNDSFVVHDTSKEDKIATTEKTNTFLVFPWNRQGSLSNDPRTEDDASSWLRTKKESNILYSLYSNYFDDLISSSQQTDHTTLNYKFDDISTQIHLTENDFVLAMKLSRQKESASEVVYYPNIDKVLYNTSGYESLYNGAVPTLEGSQKIPTLNSPVSMRYKSTSHAVIALNDVGNGIPLLPYGMYTERATVTGNPDRVYPIGMYADLNPGITHLTVWGDSDIRFYQQGLDERSLFLGDAYTENNFLWLAELYKDVENRFGGDGEYAIKNNKWIPCGDAVTIPNTSTMTLKWTDGDTFYQRYDNLKTYAYTEEDQNQLVEILSFMCETRVNIDGRYDRNRGQMDNTLMRPGIFNLLNPVYSQSDNFFIQRGVITDSRDSLKYPNQITYSKTKISGADVDLYTNVTLGSILELDGDKGKLNKLVKFNDQLLAFQDTGISQILYNENVQIASTTGVPIEIANSGKVQGKRYIADTVGCTNKWSIVSSPVGIYFMDSHDRSMYLFNGQLQNISVQGGMNTWSKNNIPGPEVTWDAYTSNTNFRGFYDKINQEIIFANSSTALAWFEKAGAFTSFYSYENTPFFNNLDDTGVWVRKNGTLWKHNAGTYCSFFGVQKPFSMTLVGNPEPQTDKIFTNLEIAASITGEGTVSNSKLTPFLPFSHLEAWNEYQHGIATLSHLTGSSAMKHFMAGANSLKRKFRLWRCDIPRDNAAIDSSIAAPFSTDAVLGIKRFAPHAVDRLRNPWLYLKLYQGTSGSDKRTEIHDIIMTYFN